MLEDAPLAQQVPVVRRGADQKLRYEVAVEIPGGGSTPAN
jgi:hypothetical protein